MLGNVSFLNRTLSAVSSEVLHSVAHTVTTTTVIRFFRLLLYFGLLKQWLLHTSPILIFISVSFILQNIFLASVRLLICCANCHRIYKNNIKYEAEQNILSRSYPACYAHAPYYIVTCGLYGCTVFFHVIS
jgi:hypothetical protein